MGAVDLAVCGVKRLVKRRARAMGSMGSMGSMGVQWGVLTVAEFRALTLDPAQGAK